MERSLSFTFLQLKLTLKVVIGGLVILSVICCLSVDSLIVF